MVERRNINRGYRKLEIWQKAVELFVHIDEFCRQISILDLKLRSQILNAAQSVSSNIAEGYCRRGVNEYRQFLYIALGSLGELMTRLTCAFRTGLLSEEQFDQLDALHYHIENMILRLLRTLQEKSREGSWNTKIREHSALYRTDCLLHPCTKPDQYEAEVESLDLKSTANFTNLG